MSAHYTKPGLPALPEPCRAFQYDSVRAVESDFHTPYAMLEYGQACYDAGRADHIAEVGQMAPLTKEQVQEIEMRFSSLKRFALIEAVIRATENAHGIAGPKEAK